jgi:divinyl protochlorophyllide a 8-vinyl-reductase
MVDEAEVVALYRALREAFPPPASEAIAERAGAKTGEYILRHRIPAPARAVLRLLPARLSAKMLLAAIGKHAWTFAGSAHVEIADASPALVTLEGCPVCAGAVASSPLCRYYGATFECLFQRLVSAGTRVRESSCQALGDACCTFEIRYER